MPVEWRGLATGATLVGPYEAPCGGGGMSQTVTREIALGDVGRAGPRPDTVLRLDWSESDPLAVVLVVAAKPSHPSLLRGRWVVLRDRLAGAVAGTDVDTPTAAGHVQINLHGEQATLTLRGATLPCVVTIPVAPLRSFLAETAAIVPPGGEGCAAALEAELSRMLGRGGSGGPMGSAGD
jgi:Streptomyces sporulation and cell division protein, SsgA